MSTQRFIKFRRADAELELELETDALSLRHTAEFSDDEALGTESAWRLSLATLGHYLEHHDGKYRRTHWSIRPAKTTLQDAHAFFTVPGAMNAWLTREATIIGDPGSEFEFEFAWGGRMSGTVLAHTPGRDVALSWREQDESVLALRTLPSPTYEGERLIVVMWSRWSETAHTRNLAGELDGAVARLCRVLDSTGHA
jgi:hypothetical protein